MYVKKWGDAGNSKSGDVHFYTTVDNALNTSTFPRAKFVSEFGFQSFPSWQAVKKYSEPQDWSYLSPLSTFLQRHPGDTEDMMKQMDLHYQVRNESFFFLFFLASTSCPFSSAFSRAASSSPPAAAAAAVAALSSSSVNLKKNTGKKKTATTKTGAPGIRPGGLAALGAELAVPEVDLPDPGLPGRDLRRRLDVLEADQDRARRADDGRAVLVRGSFAFFFFSPLSLFSLFSLSLSSFFSPPRPIPPSIFLLLLSLS